MMRPLLLFCGLMLFSVAALGGLVVSLNARVPQTVVAPVPTPEPVATPTPLASTVIAAAPIPEATMEAIRKGLTTRAAPDTSNIIHVPARGASKNSQLPNISGATDFVDIHSKKRHYNLTAEEADYSDEMQKILKLATQSMSHPDMVSNASSLAQAQAEANAAWRMKMGLFPVPRRFQLADSYFSQALSKLRWLYVEFELIKSGMANRKQIHDEITDIRKLFAKACHEMQERVDETATS